MSVLLLLSLGSTHAETYYVNQANSSASDANSGLADKPFKTISAAATVANPGDKVLVCPGIYRERVTPARGGKPGAPVVYQSEPEHAAIVRGSEPWMPVWRKHEGGKGVYFTVIPDEKTFPGPNPFRIRLNVDNADKNLPLRPGEPGKLLPYSLGQIYADGIPLVQAQKKDEVSRVAGSWIVTEDEKEIMVHFPDDKTPEECQIEITVRDRLFAPLRRGLGFIEVRGFVFEHCSNQGPFPQRGAVSVRSGKNWRIENNIIRFAQTIGLDCGSEHWNGKAIPDAVTEDQRLITGGQHLIFNNRITDNGLCGLAGWNHKGTKIIGNVFERNNRFSLSSAECSWEEWAAIKMHESDALVEGNLVRNNYCHGIWLDNGYNKARITRNLITNNQGAGVFIELGAGRCLIDNNIISDTTPLNTFYNGVGIYAHDASGLTVAHNLLLNNSSAAVRMTRVTKRQISGRDTEASDEIIVNNIISGNRTGVELPFPSEVSRNCRSDWNVFFNHRDIFRFVYCLGQPGKENIETQIKEKAGAALGEDFAAWQKNGMASQKLWRAVTGWSRNSLVMENKDLKCKLKIFENTITVTVNNDKLLQMNCPPVESVKEDFTGTPLIPEHVIPGPFQKLKPGQNYYMLFPVMSNKTGSLK
jgi:parallel beta-helix repeat protein